MDLMEDDCVQLWKAVIDNELTILKHKVLDYERYITIDPNPEKTKKKEDYINRLYSYFFSKDCYEVCDYADYNPEYIKRKALEIINKKGNL